MIVISIHAPREGGDSNLFVRSTCRRRFQSTPPARGATRNNTPELQITAISIHAPREGGDSVTCNMSPASVISIHAPREGGDFDENTLFL